MNLNLHKNKSAIFKILFFIVILVVGFSILSKHITFIGGLPTFKKKKVVQKQAVEDIAVPVKGYKVTRVDFSDTLPSLGTVKGYREIELKFAESGYIEYINFRDGEKAVEGDIIGSLDQREKLLKLEYAKNEMERTQKMFDLGALADSKLQQTKLEYQSARLEYEKTNLVAPFDGYLGSVEKQKGDFVTPNDVFGSFVNLTDAYAEFGAIEKDISKVKVGLPVTMTVDSFPQDTFSGEIESISPIVEGRTRTFKVKARIVNEGEKLKAGMFGRVGVQIYQKEHTLVIPSSAFRKKEQEYFVYVIHPDEPAEAEDEPAVKAPKGKGKGKGDPKAGAATAQSDMPAVPAQPDVIIGTIEIRPIQVAYATPDAVEIKAGLEDEELIVADIQQELEEKAKVEVTEVQEYTF
jgi:membrane fusion protein (multidrug efflux system)